MPIRRIIRLILAGFLVLSLGANIATARQKTMVGGVDADEIKAALNIMRQQRDDALNALVAAEAKSTVGAGDAKETADQLKATADYWRAWCGRHPGCNLAEPEQEGAR